MPGSGQREVIAVVTRQPEWESCANSSKAHLEQEHVGARLLHVLQAHREGLRPSMLLVFPLQPHQDRLLGQVVHLVDGSEGHTHEGGRGSRCVWHPGKSTCREVTNLCRMARSEVDTTSCGEVLLLASAAVRRIMLSNQYVCIDLCVNLENEA